MPAPDIEELNSKIAEAGADWIAAETPYSYLDGTTSNSESMGLALTPEDAYADLLAARQHDQTIMFAVSPPPQAMDWRHQGGVNWVTPVRDQGRCGACVAFATVATMESRTLIGNNISGVDFDLSEAHLFYCGTPNACARGWQPADALAFAQATGLGREASFPYTAGNQPCRPVPIILHGGNPSTAATMQARKQAIADGPAIACMAVYGDFFSYSSGVYRHVSGVLAGYHAVCVVGYDDAGGYWIAKNSWRDTWGENGFFRIRYGECGFDSQFPFYFPDSISLVPGTTIP